MCNQHGTSNMECMLKDRIGEINEIRTNLAIFSRYDKFLELLWGNLKMKIKSKLEAFLQRLCIELA